MRLLLKGGTVVDQSGARTVDVAVHDGTIVEIGERITADGDTTVLDAVDCIVSPGFVDVHAHLRQPGGEAAETILTGSQAAALGGYTAVVAMPNTQPATDNTAIVDRVRTLGAAGPIDVFPSAAITRGRQGQELAPLGALYNGGVRFFTDDGDCVASAVVMRRALEYLGGLKGAVLAQHAEDPTLVAGGHMHEGEWSSRLGIPGRPAAAEHIIIARDIELLREFPGVTLHFQHVSTARSVELIRQAKADGLAVTAEATPHHFTLTDECCAGFDPVFKVNPPLRTDTDREAVRLGLADGTIDVIATDHAPHPTQSKDEPFDAAPPGMLGLETALGLVVSQLIEPGYLDWSSALAALSWRPARLAGIATHGRPIAVGEPANCTIVDPAHMWTVHPERLASIARNTPYAGWELTGRVLHTIVDGVPVVTNATLEQTT